MTPQLSFNFVDWTGRDDSCVHCEDQVGECGLPSL